MGMKVKDVMIRIHDIDKCRALLEQWANGTVSDPNQIAAIVDEIDAHLDAYMELLSNKEVKWE